MGLLLFLDNFLFHHLDHFLFRLLFLFLLWLVLWFTTLVAEAHPWLETCVALSRQIKINQKNKNNPKQVTWMQRMAFFFDFFAGCFFSGSYSTIRLGTNPQSEEN